jgi:prepilin-type N-terminal cleavage/methylation domain-containing protein
MEQRYGGGHERRRHGVVERLPRLILDRKGLSLIELLVAVTLMAIGFLGVVAMFPMGSRTVAESGLQSVAVELAQQGMEQLLSLSYDDTKLSPSTEHTESVTVGERTYSVGWVVTKDVPIEGCKKVVYTVSWDDDDELRQVAVTGVIASSGRI